MQLVSALFRVFSDSYWQPQERIRGIFRIFITVTCEIPGCHTHLVHALLTQARNLLSTSDLRYRLTSTVSSTLSPFAASLERTRDQIQLGAEKAMRMFRSKCILVQQLMQYLLDVLLFQKKKEGAFQPLDLVFEHDWEHLLDLIIFSTSHLRTVRLKYSSSTDVFYRQAELRRYFENEIGSDEAIVMNITLTGVRCMEELMGYAKDSLSLSALLLGKIMTSLQYPKAAQSNCASRIILLIALNLVTNTITCSPTSTRTSTLVGQLDTRLIGSVCHFIQTQWSILEPDMNEYDTHACRHLAFLFLEQVLRVSRVSSLYLDKYLLGHHHLVHSRCATTQLLHCCIFNLLCPKISISGANNNDNNDNSNDNGTDTITDLYDLRLAKAQYAWRLQVRVVSMNAI